MDTPHIPAFMPGGAGMISKMTEEEETQQNFKISKAINAMDAELKDRFKALKSIYDINREFEEEEQKEIRQLEIEFENKYKEIYARREQLINGKVAPDEALIKEFEERATKMKDADYDKLEVTPCDVKSIQNIPKGVSDFWIKAMLNHPVGTMISEKDRPILGYLTNIELELHSEGEGYDLIFTFLPNSYFVGTEIKKSLTCKDKGVLDQTTSTKIQWKDACNPTVKKQKKKKGGKKVNVEVKCESFFNFFNDIVPDESQKLPAGGDDDEEPTDLDEIHEKLADDLDMADQFKDDLVPLALEYYLGVIEIDEGDDDNGSNGDNDDNDSDEDEKPKKKAGKKGGKGDMPLGPDGKPQDCKQQ